MPWTVRLGLLISVAILAAATIGLWADREASPGVRPTTIRVGVLPGTHPDRVRADFEPLVRRLEERLGVPCTLVVPPDYVDLLERFGRKEIDLAWFGALTFLRAQRASGAVPLVMRDVDPRMTTVFLARRADAHRPLTEFRGRRLALGDRMSTSGHLMPRSYLERADLEIEATFPGYVFTGAHDATAFSVRDGKADLGAANARQVESMYADGSLSRDEVVIVARTPPYIDYTWAIQPDLSAELAGELREALLALDPSDPTDAEILRRQDCDGYVPVVAEEFAAVAEVARHLRLLGAD